MFLYYSESIQEQKLFHIIIYSKSHFLDKYQQVQDESHKDKVLKLKEFLHCICVLKNFQISSESLLESFSTSPRGFLSRDALFFAAMTASSLVNAFPNTGSLLLSIKSGDLQSDSKLDFERIVTCVFLVTKRFSSFSIS